MSDEIPRREGNRLPRVLDALVVLAQAEEFQGELDPRHRTRGRDLQFTAEFVKGERRILFEQIDAIHVMNARLRGVEGGQFFQFIPCRHTILQGDQCLGMAGFPDHRRLRRWKLQGFVVGEASTSGDYESHAFLYDGQNMQDLGTLGGSHSIATAMNDAGQIVGISWIEFDMDTEAFLYDNGQMLGLGHLGGGGRDRPRRA